MRLAMMKTDHEQVRLVVSEKTDDSVHFLALQKMSPECDSFALCGLAGIGPQPFIGLHPIGDDCQPKRRVDSVGIGRVGRRCFDDHYWLKAQKRDH